MTKSHMFFANMTPCNHKIWHGLENGTVVHPNNKAVRLCFAQSFNINNILKLGLRIYGKITVLTIRVRMELWMSLGTKRTSVDLSAIFVCTGMASMVTAPFYQSATAICDCSTADFLLSYMEINKWCEISLERSSFEIFYCWLVESPFIHWRNFEETFWQFYDNKVTNLTT